MKTLAASDRSSLVKLAGSLPKGDETRRAILSGLRNIDRQELKTLASELVGYAYDGDGAEVLSYFAQDDSALMEAAVQAGFEGEDVLEYFMELSPRERLKHLQRA